MKNNEKIKGWKILRAYIEVISKLKAFSYKQNKRIPEDVTTLDKNMARMEPSKKSEITTISVKNEVTNTLKNKEVKTVRKVRYITFSPLTHKKKVKILHK